jgi:simple sugar transport system substrate-binding protein
VSQHSTRIRLGLSGLVFALALGACSQASTPSSSASAPAAPVTVAMITHETPGDTYWDIIRSGAKKAAEQLGVTLKYSSDPDFTKQATLVQNAIDSKVDGIAMTAAGPSALTGAVKAANDAGVPVVMFDSGIEDWQMMGAMMYFGSDEYIAGQALGKRIAIDGGKHVLCVIHQEGSTALEARCKGVGEGVASENMQVNGTDDASVNASIVAKLQQDPSIDYIVTMGAPVALVALDAIGVAGSKAKVATFDLNLAAAEAIKAGTIAMAVDAQPYLQGYLAVTSLWLFKTNGNVIGGGLSTLTGPAIVDASNIDVILPFAQNGTR